MGCGVGETVLSCHWPTFTLSPPLYRYCLQIFCFLYQVLEMVVSLLHSSVSGGLVKSNGLFKHLRWQEMVPALQISTLLPCAIRLLIPESHDSRSVGVPLYPQAGRCQQSRSVHRQLSHSFGSNRKVCSGSPGFGLQRGLRG